ncbi:hypothetical protein ABUW04_09645 [Streptacidiphilus sp. N1-10]|uniref:Uncharacterized protein n=1 Tax=Streptacidiphilus jeojiensis TaxID=3229225 RepID=A0ABV6XJS9_9ACTN
MATIEAAGNLYAYRVRGCGRSGVVLWIGGRGDDPDQVLALPAAGGRRLPVFVTVRQARMYVRRRGRVLGTPGVNTLELRRVQHWSADPVRRQTPPGAVLEAWNFFEDLARGLGSAHRLPRQGPVHDAAYRKLFEGECSAWSSDERRAALEVVRAGVELWDFCPVIVKPR